MTTHDNDKAREAVELLPCPFCGCHGVDMQSDSVSARRHTIKCQDCPGRAEFFSSDRLQAIAAWNRRSALTASEAKAAPAQQEPVAEVRQGLNADRIDWLSFEAQASTPVGTKLYAASVAAQPQADEGTDYECPDCGKLNYRPLDCGECGRDYDAAQPQEATIKDHLIAQAINELRYVALKFHATQQLRDRIARIAVPLARGDAAELEQEIAAARLVPAPVAAQPQEAGQARELPPMPEPDVYHKDTYTEEEIVGHSSDQMREYGSTCVDLSYSHGFIDGQEKTDVMRRKWQEAEAKLKAIAQAASAVPNPEIVDASKIDFTIKVGDILYSENWGSGKSQVEVVAVNWALRAVAVRLAKNGGIVVWPAASLTRAAC